MPTETEILKLVDMAKGMAISASRRGMGDPTELESAANFAVAKALHTFDPERATLNKWTRLCVFNALRNHYRDVGKYNAKHELAGDSLNDFPDGRDEMSVEDRIYILAALDTISNLSDTEQAILDLRYNEGLSISEVANRLGVSKPTVNGLHYRAMNYIKHNHTMRSRDGQPE